MAPQATAVPPPPPLFLTKRVTAFLRANLSNHIRAAVLTTPAGNLLVHASTLPASVLRRQCAVAASLWALQHPASTSDDASTNNIHSSSSSPVPSSSTASLRSTGAAPSAVTVQLDSGVVFVIRQLHCGMLFICMGGDEPLKTPTQSIVNGGASSTSLASHEGQDAVGAGSLADAAMSPGSSTPLASPSQESTAPSSLTAATTGGLSPANVRALRRHVEELARWLDARLGALSVPEAGIGVSLSA